MPIHRFEMGAAVCRTISHHLQPHPPKQRLFASLPQVAVADTVVPF